MRHRRSPRCTYCHTQGHTKRACPTVKEQAAAARLKPAAERDWLEQRAIERVDRYKEVSSSRSCSYCNTSGHNAKGCSTRKDDIIYATSQLVSFRKKFLQALKTHGLGIGAIVSYNGYFPGFGYSDDGKPHPAIVTGFIDGNAVYWNCYNRRDKLNDTLRINHLGNLDHRVNRYDSSASIPSVVTQSIDTGCNNWSDKTQIVSTINTVGINETEFVSYTKCQELVVAVFDQKRRGTKPYSRSDVRSEGLIIEY